MAADRVSDSNKYKLTKEKGQRRITINVHSFLPFLDTIEK